MTRRITRCMPLPDAVPVIGVPSGTGPQPDSEAPASVRSAGPAAVSGVRGRPRPGS